MTNPEASASARVAAARSVLQFAMQAVQSEDLEARLATLEHHLAQRAQDES
jgi:hypothetical protein